MADPSDIYQVYVCGATALLTTVRIYNDSLEHIKQDHPDVPLELLDKTIKDPCYVTDSRTRVGSYVFINEQDVNSLGEPLRVPVKAMRNGTGVIKSAYFSDATYHGKTVWRRGDG